ncbi:MAG: hypothetical protein HZB13_20205 [Acidobacteria bacterium]|nr:hypothetical protein [Acidobacteriota bacterium]
MRYLVALMAFTPLMAAEPGCVTPAGTPCYSVRTAVTTWTLFREGLGDFRRDVSERFFAVRADGSTIAMMGEGEAGPPPPKTLWLASLGQEVAVDEVTRLVRYGAPFAPRREPEYAGDQSCQQAAQTVRRGVPMQLAGVSNRLGVRVVEWQGEVAVGGILRHVRAELAPSLDCACLYSRETERAAGWLPYLIRTRQATWLRLGAPEASLFEIPAGFRAMGTRASR